MEAAILDIISGILGMDTERIRQSTAKMMKAYENPDSLLVLTQIVMSDRAVQERHVAAVLLKRRISKLRHWQLVPAEHQSAIKTNMLQVLIAVKEKTVKGTVAQIIGSLVRHEAEKEHSWLEEILKFIYERCSSPDPTESERGSSIFTTLMDAAPDQFSNHMDTIFPLFAGVLVTAEANGNMATPTVFNVLTGTCYLLPFVSGHSGAEQIVVKAVPLILKALGAFAEKGDSQEFMGAFNIIDAMGEYVPHLLTGNVKLILEFCLIIASNQQLEDSIRVQVITFVGSLMRLKKKVIMKQKLLEPTLAVMFEVMCQDSLDDDDDYFSSESSNSPSTAATQTLDLMALHMSPEKFIPPLLQLLEPALQSPQPVLRRSSFICMGVIAEGCSEAIGNKYLEVMLNIVKAGIFDSVMLVRVAAFFALGQFSEYLQPTICKYAPQILPVLFDYLSQLVMELKAGHNSNVPAKDSIMYLDKIQIKRRSVLAKYRIGTPEPKHMDRMFYALETFCENLGDDIIPHLPTLMERLFGVLEPQNSHRMREMGLTAIAAVSTAAKEHLVPYFPRIMSVLQGCLVKECPKEMQSLRIQAIDTLAALCREVGRDNIIPLADDTMNFCLMMLEDGPDDPEVRRSIYNLMSSLSSVVKESMATVFPKFIDRIMESVISSEDVLPNVSENPEDDLILDTTDVEIDLDQTDDEDDQDCYQVENDYVFEKEEAILALREFAAHTGAAFAPYLQSAFENVYKMIDHPQGDVRKACIDAICGFITALHKLEDAAGLKRACEIAIPKFAHMLRTDDEVGVVLHLLDELGDVFKDVQLQAINNQEHAELIFGCIRDVFTNKMACQFNEESGGGDEEDSEESENDEMLFENAANLFPLFGLALQPELFSLYFGRLYQFYVQRLAKAKERDIPEHRAYIYGALADSFKALKGCSATYFDALCPIFITGSKDSDAKSRQNSYYALGELVIHSEEKSFESYPVILQALSEAIVRESNPPALDNICGAVARLIVTNPDSVPLAQVLPVLLNHLPLKEDVIENDMIQKAFRVLYLKARPSIVAHLEQILVITIEAIYKKQMPDDETTESAVALIKEIRANYPEQFNQVSNANPEVFNYVQTLFIYWK
ncbi:importin-4 isoform X1 [Drosophila erecta]|uniref:importin-4 isoform X1 n=1 Tax=Drosophila erecta TaxID=7220 RepID=UPI000F0629FD|nr:importin-4 isoform X1 [Drosophila erecta]